jgi:3-hydroxy-3-methylglutaryl CoA synthase
MIRHLSMKQAMNIIGYGIYVPRQRLPQSEINVAWNRPGGKGTKAVAARDEDVVTMGVKAAKQALVSADLTVDKLGVIYAASVSSGYMENTVAAQTAYALGAEGDLSVADFGLSTRSITAALRSCIDAIASGRIEYGLIVGSEKLIAQPGSSYELSRAAGAGAVILGREGGLAAIERSASYTSGFVGRFRPEGKFHGVVDDRFVMQHGYLEHVCGAVERLTKGKQNDWNHVVLHAPEASWAGRALKRLKLDPQKLVSSFAEIGYAGCGSFLIDLALALERAKPSEKILAISYGPGGSDAIELRALRAEENSTIQAQLANGVKISYPTYLRYCGLYREE